MSDYVTDEMVETAARAMDHAYNPDRSPILAAMFRDYALAALEAVAPLIAAAALRDAADREMAAWESVPMSPDWTEAIESVCETLRARADEMEAGR